jgi:hypothetical protein
VHNPRPKILNEIVDELRPLRDAAKESDAMLGVRIVLRYMDQHFMPIKDRRSIKQNRTSSKQIQRTINKLRYQIRSAPWPVRVIAETCNGNDPLLPLLEQTLMAADAALSGFVEQDATADIVKPMCACCAYATIEAFSEKRPTSSSAASPLRVIAGLIYECCTGRQQDLERACEAALQWRPTMDEIIGRYAFKEGYDHFIELERALVQSQNKKH